MISVKELNKVFTTLNLEEKYIQNLVKDVDQNGDGEVDTYFIKIFIFFYFI